MTYESFESIESTVDPGVSYRLKKMSFARRVELMKRVREIAPRLEFAAAGASVEDRLDARLIAAEIDSIYLKWGLEDVAGLDIDGERATVDTFVALAPEHLFSEALACVKKNCRLSETEIKN